MNSNQLKCICRFCILGAGFGSEVSLSAKKAALC